MGRNLYKFINIFYNVIVISISRRHQDATAKKVKGFPGILQNISKTVQLIFKLMSFLLITYSIV